MMEERLDVGDNCWKKYGVVMNSLEVVVNSLTVIRFDLKGAGGTLIRLI